MKPGKRKVTTSARFDRLDPTRLGGAKKSAFIAMHLLEAIRNGVYKAGDKLPSERELSEQLGVSRNPVREALSALRLAGVVESLPGDGTYVKNSGPDLELRVQEILKTGGSPLEAWEARKHLEPKISELAALQATPADLASLSRALERMAVAITKRDVAEFFKADSRFHLALAEATHNHFIRSMMSPLIRAIAHELWWEIKREHIQEDVRPFELSLELHRDIYEAILDHNPKGAHDAMDKHFEELGKYL